MVVRQVDSPHVQRVHEHDSVISCRDATDDFITRCDNAEPVRANPGGDMKESSRIGQDRDLPCADVGPFDPADHVAVSGQNNPSQRLVNVHDRREIAGVCGHLRQQRSTEQEQA